MELETIGRYRVIRPLGQGGMGQVYLAHDPTLERDVALKLVHLGATDGGLRHEAKALAALNHPGIVTIFEIGEHDGQDFIAMEYLPGRSLREVLVAGASRERLLKICRMVVVAVAAAHHAKILHRDIKPENIIVGEHGDVKVVDFGIARRMERGNTRRHRAVTASELVDMFTRTMPAVVGSDTVMTASTQTMFGTPAYMAPEMLVGEPSVPASDVYGLGMIIYECLAGHRPYAGSSLAEAIAQTIVGTAPRLDDPLADLVERMLARDPLQRPSLVDVAIRLSERPSAPAIVHVVPPTPPARRRRWPVITIVAIAVVALGIGGAQLATRSTDPRPAGTPSTPSSATVAIAPIAIAWPTYGADPVPTAVGETLALLVGELDGTHVRGITTGSADPAAARTLGASHLVSGRIDEHAGRLEAQLELVTIATGARIALHEEVPTPRIARLLDTLAARIGNELGPGITLELRPNRPRAETFLQRGTREIARGRFADARSYLEQAVDADPSFGEAWYQSQMALAWTDADHALLEETNRHAFELTAPGPKKELMRAMSLYLEQRWGEMRQVLEPVEHATGPDAPDRKELLYYLGEANWHDGRQAAGFAYFKASLDLDRDFRPPTVHAYQYTVARRDPESRRYVALAGETPEWTELALGHYDELARTGSPQFALQALLVLGRPIPPALQDQLTGATLDAGTYRIALAAGDGDLARASTEFAALWASAIASKDPKQIVDGDYNKLEALGEVLISAGMAKETRQLVELLLAQHKPTPTRGYQRISIVAAPILGDASVIYRDKVSERNSRLIVASEAELAGDRAKAAAILTELVADPTFFWDYPERAALARNLRALHRRGPLAAVCADTMHPAVFRPAFLVLRRICKK